MKKVLAIIAEFILFLLLDVLGGIFYHPFHIETSLPDGQGFSWDGVLFMLLAWLLLIVIAAARKHFAASAVPLTIALVLAALAGFFLKVGSHHPL